MPSFQKNTCIRGHGNMITSLTEDVNYPNNFFYFFWGGGSSKYVDDGDSRKVED